MRQNVLIFGHNYATQFIDISNQYTRLFDKDKYDVTVAYLVGAPDEAVKQKHIAENILFMNCSRKAVRGLKFGAIKTVVQLAREKRFEIVICHRYKPTYIMLCAALFTRIGVLYSVMHDLKTLSSYFRRLVIAALARKNMIFSGVSNAVRDDMRRDILNVPNTRVITLYNSIDVEMTETRLRSREEARKQFNIPEDTFVFGNIARLVKVKDQHSLIQALHLIKPQCPQAKLILMGDGDLEAELKAQVKSLGLENDVIFAGFVPDAFQYIPLFDAFVLCSTREAFGRVLIEAQVAKTPIIATRTNGIPEVVGDSGIIVEAMQPEQLAAAMLKVAQLSAAERQAMGEAGYQRMQTCFSIPAFNNTFWKTYQEARGLA